jgi:hypothetical protein
MYEQMSIFDLMEDKPKPYSYDWIREIGMPVRYCIDDRVRTGTIHSFDHYYTFVETDDHRLLALTNLNCWPFEDIEQMTLADVAEKVGNALGITFTKTPPASSKYAEYGDAYEAKAKGYKLEISIDRYDTMDDRDGSAFIGVEYSCAKGAGGGAPCDTVNEAILYFEKLLKGEHK